MPVRAPSTQLRSPDSRRSTAATATTRSPDPTSTPAGSSTGADAGALDTVALRACREPGRRLGRGCVRVAVDSAAGGSLTGSIDGGGGSDALVAPDTTNDWAISGQNVGTLTFDDGGTAVPIAFASIENLIGGSERRLVRLRRGRRRWTASSTAARPTRTPTRSRSTRSTTPAWSSPVARPADRRRDRAHVHVLDRRPRTPTRASACSGSARRHRTRRT